ncbi:MAG: Gfo/Idh/MocA family oxidoreductase [Treponema sp.]|jgi:predicted dehydrogenase|nr:Gfo/Idh/MocA family oxidoreductase [Treponema sp.]
MENIPVVPTGPEGFPRLGEADFLWTKPRPHNPAGTLSASGCPQSSALCTGSRVCAVYDDDETLKTYNSPLQVVSAEPVGKIRVAVVGLGRIASLLEEDPLREKPCTHTGAVIANPDCTLVGGADKDEHRRDLFKKRWGSPVYADAQDMIKDLRPHILIIATNPDSHAAYCSLASSCKVPVAVCEKPLADSLEKARHIAYLHEEELIKILTNHERRYAEDYIEAKSILGKKDLGDVLSVKASLYMGSKRSLIDILWHDGTHLADAVMFLTGFTMIHEQKWGSRFDSQRGTAFLAGYLEAPKPLVKAPEPSIPFVIELGGKRDHIVFEIEFSCEQGRLRIGNGIFEVWNSSPSPYAEGYRSLQRHTDGFKRPTYYFVNMLSDAVRCVLDPRHQPRSSALDGLKVINYLNSIRPWRNL